MMVYPASIEPIRERFVRLRRIVVAAVAAGLLAGCATPATQEPPPTPQQAVAAAAKRTTAVGSARISRTIQWLDAAGNQVGSLVRVEGVIDFTHHLARLDTTTAKTPTETSRTRPATPTRGPPAATTAPDTRSTGTPPPRRWLPG